MPEGAGGRLSVSTDAVRNGVKQISLACALMSAHCAGVAIQTVESPVPVCCVNGGRLAAGQVENGAKAVSGEGEPKDCCTLKQQDLK